MKKYELTDEQINYLGRKLYRIRAIATFGSIEIGEKGGFVESEENLAQNDNAWIADNAVVLNEASVFDNAWISGNAKIIGEAKVSGKAWVHGDAWIFGKACVYGSARVHGDAWISGNAHVFGDSHIYSKASIHSNAQISHNTHLLHLGPLGLQNKFITFFRTEDNKICISSSFFSGYMEDFEQIIEKKYGDTKYGMLYRKAAELAKIQIEENLI